ncbi:MAG: FAD-binding protein [Ardenticatenaceae bacterium]|nr:FAD-binding protein [Ardenticatenaceae bacterium]
MVEKQPIVNELIDLVKMQERVWVRGGGSKPSLSANGGEIQFDLRRLSGLIEYDPGEYTFTAWAGTPIKEIAAVLAEHQQYLPFDPLFIEEGSTLGGTIVANTAGSGRYRYGGVRDFLIGIQFVDGRGELIRGGGKVVKNASGFDLPKFFVGSLGRYGVLVETTWKVFPQPFDYANIQVTYLSAADLQQASFALATSPLEMDVQDWMPQDDRWVLDIRMGGLPDVIPSRLERLTQFLNDHSQPVDFLIGRGPEETAKWRDQNSCRWQPNDTILVKIPLNPQKLTELETIIDRYPRRYTAAGNTAWVAVDTLDHLPRQLDAVGLTGLVLRGDQLDEPIIGRRKGMPLAQRVKRALDPNGVFGEV